MPPLHAGGTREPDLTSSPPRPPSDSSASTDAPITAGLGPEGLVPRFIALAAAPLALATRTVPRRRMAVLAGTAALFGLFTAGLDVMLPLWVTRGLGMSAADWSMLRSLRMGGILAGVIVLGAVSDRLGARGVTAASMLGTAGLLGVIALAPRRGVWLTMPLLGALVSTAFVNLNTLTQFVSDRRQGLANTIYRGVGAAAGVAAPIAVTALAARWGGYPPLLAGFIVLLLGAAALLSFYPEPCRPPPLSRGVGGLRGEIAALLHGYRDSLRQRELMWFTNLYVIWCSLLTGVTTFAAIRFTKDLGKSDEYVGLLTGIAGAATLAATLAGGFFLDRVRLRGLMGWGAVAGSLFATLMGVSDRVGLSALGFLGFTPLFGLLISPSSMWISRAAAPGRQTAAFAVAKITTAAYYAAAVAAAGALEPRLGMRRILLWGGLLSLAAAVGFFALPEPARPAASASDDTGGVGVGDKDRAIGRGA